MSLVVAGFSCLSVGAGDDSSFFLLLAVRGRPFVGSWGAGVAAGVGVCVAAGSTGVLFCADNAVEITAVEKSVNSTPIAIDFVRLISHLQKTLTARSMLSAP